MSELNKNQLERGYFDIYGNQIIEKNQRLYKQNSEGYFQYVGKLLVIDEENRRYQYVQVNSTRKIVEREYP